MYARQSNLTKSNFIPCVYLFAERTQGPIFMLKMKGKRILKQEIKCLICGKTFHAEYNRIQKGRAKFCSTVCYGVWQSKNFILCNSHNWKGGGSDRRCLVCGKEFKAVTSEVKKGKSKFCSHKCYSLWLSKNKIGENSYRWKGGITPTHLIIRGSIQYSKWRNEIFKRDNFACQKCGNNTSGELNAHHIKKFSAILNDIKQKFPLFPIIDISKNINDLWNISNGVTLCKKCHKKEHKINSGVIIEAHAEVKP